MRAIFAERMRPDRIGCSSPRDPFPAIHNLVDESLGGTRAWLPLTTNIRSSPRWRTDCSVAGSHPRRCQGLKPEHQRIVATFERAFDQSFSVVDGPPAKSFTRTADWLNCDFSARLGSVRRSRRRGRPEILDEVSPLADARHPAAGRSARSADARGFDVPHRAGPIESQIAAAASRVWRFGRRGIAVGPVADALAPASRRANEHGGRREARHAANARCSSSSRWPRFPPTCS